MNRLIGEIRIGNDGDRRSNRPTTLVESTRDLSHDDANCKLSVLLTTLTASFYAAGPYALLVWGLNPTHTRLRARSDFEEFATQLARDPKLALQRLAGGWGLVFADDETGRLLIAADRSAQRPACFHASAGRLVFGLSAHDVSMAVHDRLRLRPQAIFDYLRAHVIAAPETIFADVSRIQPGEFISVDAKGISRSFYWEPSYKPDDVGLPSFSNAREKFVALLEDAVRAELGAGKTGAFLSGGTDSSTIAGMLGKVTNEPANTFSIGFDAPGFDEMAYARIAARHFKTAHHEYYVTPDDLAASIPEVSRAFDQPFGNSSALPAYYCARLAAADGVTKLVGGDGGDELFGGNTRYAKQKLFDAYRHVPKGLDRGVIEKALVRPALSGRLPLIGKLKSYVLQARLPMPERLHTYNLIARLGILEVFTEEFLAQVATNAPVQAEAAWYRRCDASDIVSRMLQYDWKYTLSDNDLPKVITACDLAGVSVGFPMLDERLVHFANALPPAWKIKGLRLRPFFKSALSSFLPNEIIRKRKHGFGLPFGWWLVKHAGLRELAFGALQSFRTRQIVRSQLINELVDSRLAEHAGYYGELIWTMMILELWLQARGNNQARDASRLPLERLSRA